MKLEHRRGADMEWQSPGQRVLFKNVGDWNESGQGLPSVCSQQPLLWGAASVSHTSPSSVQTGIPSPAGRLALELDTCHLLFVGLHLWGHTPEQASIRKGHKKGADRRRNHSSCPMALPVHPALGLQTYLEV